MASKLEKFGWNADRAIGGGFDPGPVANIVRQYDDNQAAANPPPTLHPPGAEYAQSLAAKYHDAPTAASTVGVHPQMRGLGGMRAPAPVQNPDIFIGGDTPAATPVRPQFAPSRPPDGVVLPPNLVRSLHST